MKFSSIDIFCHRVDNYGDVGVAYRFAREFKIARPDCRVRAFFDNLNVLHEIADEIDPEEVIQERGSILYIKSWALSKEQIDALGVADVMVEMFACEIPEPFMEPAYDNSKLIINLEYLSAEEWVEEYHLKESLLGRGTARKFFFLPGFRETTGGLIINSRLREIQESGGIDRLAFINGLLNQYEVSRYDITNKYELNKYDISNKYESDKYDTVNQYELNKYGITNQYESSRYDTINKYESNKYDTVNQYELNKYGLNHIDSVDNMLIGTIFTYERGFDTLLSDLVDFGRETLLLVFGEKSQNGMVATLGRLGVDIGNIINKGGQRANKRCQCQKYIYKNIQIIYMPFVNQHVYDTLLCCTDFNIVRGEDSLARAALSGKPFIWNAYIQNDNYQHVKVGALLKTLRQYFDDEGVFAAYSDLMMKFNTAPSESPEQVTSERYDIFFKNLKKHEQAGKRMYYFMLGNCDLVSKFCDFLDGYQSNMEGT